MFKKELSLQEYLSIGYIYLIVLGIVSDAFYYAVLEVSYLNYITILDALISPISLLSNNWKLALFLLLFVVLMYYYLTKFSPWFYKKMRDKKWYKKVVNIERADKINTQMKEQKNLIISLMLMFFLFFFSMRLGMGMGMKQRISEDDGIKPNYSLVFKDDTKVDVKKIGQNSAYFFYVIPGEKVVTVTPILENIKKIKRIKKLNE